MFIFGFLPILFVLFGINAFRALGRGWKGRAEIDVRPEVGWSQLEQMDGALFRLAKRRGGRITLSDIVVETGMDMRNAERYMNSLVDHSHVSVEVDARGRILYAFPELLGESGGDT